jgi:hypothetical protein
MLPPFSLPYTQYSVTARLQAVQRRFVEGCSWESSAPPVKDPNRLADPSTLRRWFRPLNGAAAPLLSLRRRLEAIRQELSRGEVACQRAWESTRFILATFVDQLWPWPLRC